MLWIHYTLSASVIFAECRKKYSVPCQKDKYSEVSKYFGTEPLEEVIDVRRDKLLKRFCTTDIYLCRLIDARH